MLVGSERSFLIDGCESGIRGDGRGHLDWRPISIDTGLVASASGSARVQIGATDVIVGVKASAAMPYATTMLSVMNGIGCALPSTPGHVQEVESRNLLNRINRWR